MSDAPLLSVKPIITYPREAQVGKTYLMTIDLQPEENFEWQYEEEEYPIYCTVDSDLFNSKPIGEPVVVLHCFGGSYGEARFLLTALKESYQEKIRVILVNRYGVPINAINLGVSQITNKELVTEIDELAVSSQLVLTHANQNNYEGADLQPIADTSKSTESEKNRGNFCRGIAKIEISETGEIFEVKATNLEWESYCVDPDRPMGEELHHYASIEIESEEGDYWIEATWNVWEYPLGSINYIEPEIRGGRLIKDFDEYFIPYQADDEQPQQLPSNFFALDDAWVGRESLIRELSDRIRSNCRLLILVGITGIGKTALGERLAVEVADWFENDWSHYHQENFDDLQQTSDFASVASRWLERWGELITPDDRRDSQRLLYRLAQHLQEHRYLIQIESLQNVLQGDEKGWSNFKDEWWLKFFESYLRAESCESCFILTSQDLPSQIEEVGMRSQNFWHCQMLSGLEQSEQMALFEKTELDVSPESISRNYLERIGSAYEGYPLALRVIAGDIKNKPFEGNVLSYWNKYGNEFEEIERAIAEAENGKSTGTDDKWQLDRFTRSLRRNVQSRLNTTFARLKEDAKWAYILLCEASVHRCPVPEDFWLNHLEDWDRNEEEQRKALDVLRDRYLIEELVKSNNYLLRQHNLIRSFTLEQLKKIDEENKL